MRLALPLVLVFAAAAGAQLPTDGRTSYSRDPDISIPFDLGRNDKATKVTLYANFEGGPWKEADSISAGGKRRFQFKADREGLYGFATLTEFKDGTTDPPNRSQLVEQKRVVYDRTPPRIVSVRPATDGNGNPGVEWEVTDENPDPRGIHLEFRWDGQGRWEPIDRGVPFNGRDSRYWKLKPRDKMQVKVVAADRAGNTATSDPVWVTGRDAEAGGSDPLPPARTTGSAGGPVRDPAVSPAAGTTAPALHYLNSRTVKLNVNVTVGPSGLKKATLWYADEKLNWQKYAKDEKQAMDAVDTGNPDQPRKLPITFTFEAPDDGLYNFIIVVENHRHASRRDPKAGDAGEIQVMVDTKPPEVDISSAQVSRNGDRGAVVDIRWKAQDKNIAALPIRLEYQPVKVGPADAGGWKAVAADNLDNTGQYTWTVPTAESHLFKLRITCKDRAGNETTKEWKEAVNTDLSVPGVEAVEVSPIRIGK